MNKTSLLLGNGIIGIVIISLFSISFADEQISNTSIIPIDWTIAIEKTILFFHAPEEPSHYWGYVEGKIANHVPGFAVVIEMYNEKESFPRYSQVDVNEDGYYEYKFRVKNVHDGELVWKMEGDYKITIFKVVYLDPRNIFV